MMSMPFVSLYGKRIFNKGISKPWRNISVMDHLETDNVFLFIPNLIGYVRALLIVSFMYFASQENYQAATVCYVLNFVLDECDGNCARYLGQTSNFGMMLDIYLDEASVCCLCMTLATLYPRYLVVFQLYAILDFLGQWSNYHYSALYKNNKYMETKDPLIHMYFNCYWMTNCWVYGNHIFLLSLFNTFYTTGPVLSLFGASVGLWKLLAMATAPWSISRLAIMAYLLLKSMYNLGNEDSRKRIADASVYRNKKAGTNINCQRRLNNDHGFH